MPAQCRADLAQNYPRSIGQLRCVPPHRANVVACHTMGDTFLRDHNQHHAEHERDVRRWCAWHFPLACSASIAAALGLGACVDTPSLDVAVVHDFGAFAAQATEIRANTRVEVYETNAVTCDDLAFGRTELSALAPFLISSNTSATTLSNVSRLDAKLIIAKGSLADGRLATIGCAELGAIEKDTTTTIATQPVALASLAVRRANGSRATAAIARLVVTDIEDRPLADRPVQWFAYAPADAGVTTSNYAVQPDGSFVYTARDAATTSAIGDSELNFPTADRPGPLALVARVKWALTQPAPQTRFVPAAVARPVALGLQGGENLVRMRTCVERVSGPPSTIACLFEVSDANGGKLIVADFTAPNGMMTATNIRRFPRQGGGFVPEHIVVAPTSDGKLMGVAANGQVNDITVTAPGVKQTGDWCVAANVANCHPVTSVVELAQVPACGAHSAGLLAKVVVQTASGPELRLAPAPYSVALGMRNETQRLPALPLSTFGAGEVTHNNLALLGGACVFDESATPPTPQGVVLTTIHDAPTISGRNGLYATLIDSTTFKRTIALSDHYAAGAIAGPEPRLLCSQRSLRGTEVVESILSKATELDPDTNVPTVVSSILRRDQAAASGVPTQIVWGHFDGDNAYDLAWSLPVVATSANGETETVMQLETSLQRRVGGQRLAAVLPIEGFGPSARMFTTDLDNDGVTDLVAVDERAFAALLMGRLALP